jgi:hypothetical protein
MESTGREGKQVQETRQGKKKAYHSPALRPCGTVRQHTRTGFLGTLTDGTNTTATQS